MKILVVNVRVSSSSNFQPDIVERTRNQSKINLNERPKTVKNRNENCECIRKCAFHYFSSVARTCMSFGGYRCITLSFSDNLPILLKEICKFFLILER